MRRFERTPVLIPEPDGGDYSDCSSEYTSGESDIENSTQNRPTRCFFGIKLTKEKPRYTWKSGENFNKTANTLLKLKQVSLGHNVKPGEINTIEVGTALKRQHSPTYTLASLAYGVQHCVPLSTIFDGIIPITFELKSGSGPVVITGFEELLDDMDERSRTEREKLNIDMKTVINESEGDSGRNVCELTEHNEERKIEENEEQGEASSSTRPDLVGRRKMASVSPRFHLKELRSKSVTEEDIKHQPNSGSFPRSPVSFLAKKSTSCQTAGTTVEAECSSSAVKRSTVSSSRRVSSPISNPQLLSKKMEATEVENGESSAIEEPIERSGGVKKSGFSKSTTFPHTSHSQSVKKVIEKAKGLDSRTPSVVKTPLVRRKDFAKGETYKYIGNSCTATPQSRRKIGKETRDLESKEMKDVVKKAKGPESRGQVTVGTPLAKHRDFMKSGASSAITKSRSTAPQSVGKVIEKTKGAGNIESLVVKIPLVKTRGFTQGGTSKSTSNSCTATPHAIKKVGMETKVPEGRRPPLSKTPVMRRHCGLVESDTAKGANNSYRRTPQSVTEGRGDMNELETREEMLERMRTERIRDFKKNLHRVRMLWHPQSHILKD